MSKFDSEATQIIEADASPVGVGTVLLQKHKDNKISILFLQVEKFLKPNKGILRLLEKLYPLFLLLINSRNLFQEEDCPKNRSSSSY